MREEGHARGLLWWSWVDAGWKVAAAHRCTAGRAAARRNLERSMGGETTEEAAAAETERRRRRGDGRGETAVGQSL